MQSVGPAYETHHLFKFIHLINQSLPGTDQTKERNTESCLRACVGKQWGVYGTV